MIQIVPQVKIYVAIEPVDFRKGIGAPGKVLYIQPSNFIKIPAPQKTILNTKILYFIPFFYPLKKAAYAAE